MSRATCGAAVIGLVFFSVLGSTFPLTAAAPKREGVQTLPGKAPEIPNRSDFLRYDMDLVKEKFYLSIPLNYTGKEPFGLVVFINAADKMAVIPEWKPVLARRKLLYIAPQNVGNSHDIHRRAGLAVVGIYKMMELYKIDPQRVYVTGLSGGARMACLAAFHHPTLISGVFPMCGAEFPAPVPRVNATQNDPYGVTPGKAELVEKAKANVRFALVTGPRDFRHGNILDIYNGGYAKEKYQARLFDVPNLGHENAGAAVIDVVLQWLDQRPAKGAKDK